MLKTAKIVGLNSDTNSALALVSRNTSGLYLFLIVSCSSDDSFSRTRSALFEAEDLFNEPGLAIGEIVRFSNQRFEVIGVAQKKVTGT